MNEKRRIIHCFRAPVGGLFRHVYDLVRLQSDLGHDVGIICDSRAGGASADDRLSSLEPYCTLGIRRFRMSRWPGPGDLLSRRAVRNFALEKDAQVLHGHGAKGGAYARLAASALRKGGKDCIAVYTPHGGALHFGPSSFAGRLFARIEHKLGKATDCLVFESEYASKVYESRLGGFPCPTFIIPNGLWPNEFYDVVVDVNAADFLFVGELRHLKGVDLFLQALAELRRVQPVTAVIVGAGPDENEFKRLAKQLNLDDCVVFPGAMPARTAFSRGRCLVVPSRAESLPYIVLEAAAARMPLILTDVGGIPEIVAGVDFDLLPPGVTEPIRAQMAEFLKRPAPFVERAQLLQNRVSHRFRAQDMGRLVCDAYERAWALRSSGNRAAAAPQ